MPGPLSGVRGIDLTGMVSGPFTTMFLVDQGADVLKIEPIGGDRFRFLARDFERQNSKACARGVPGLLRRGPARLAASYLT